MTPMQNNLGTLYRAIVFEPKLELAQLYAKYLKQQDFEAHISCDHAHLLALTSSISPKMIIYNIDAGYEPLKFIKRQSPALIVITIGSDSEEQDLDALMEIGISGHINRKVTQPRDIGILAKQLINY